MTDLLASDIDATVVEPLAKNVKKKLSCLMYTRMVNWIHVNCTPMGVSEYLLVC